MEYLPFPLEVYPPLVHGEDQAMEYQRQFTKRLFNDFWDFPIDQAHKELEQQVPEYWEHTGAQRALELFHAVSKRVPAYKDFLHKHSIDPDKIQTIDDFRNIPPTDKESYLNAYPPEALLWEGKLSDAQMVSVSSGSSGEPFFWSRGGLLELETTYIQELYLKHIFHIDRYRTLYIDAFAMGMYIAGPIILNSALRVSQKGYPMTVITPGLSMDDIMRILQRMVPHYEQVILAGYPPYIKDVVEEAARRGVEWEKYKVRLLLAGEGYSEQWREYVAKLAGGASLYEGFINIYGTADASIVGHETPLSITIRRFLDKNENLRSRLLNSRYTGRLPTLVQYIPTQKYFEEVNNELHFTATSGIPLIRYNIHDDGGLLSYQQIIDGCEAEGFDAGEELNKVAPTASHWKLPFAYLYGRSDFTVVLYGLNIYPENIKRALEDKKIRGLVSGRYLMSTEYEGENQNQYLLINIELKPEVSPSNDLAKRITEVIVSTLRQVNAEYAEFYSSVGDKRAYPVIKLNAYGNDEYFSRQKNKQHWTKRDNHKGVTI